MPAPVSSSVRPRHAAFEFRDFAIDGRTLALRYRLSGGPDAEVAFEEILELPAEIPAPDPRDPVVARLLGGIHRVFGVSYFKAAVPREIIAEPVGNLDADFWDALYTEGLGEFYFRNKLDPQAHSAFARGAAMLPPAIVQPPSSERVLVLVGGGKDSSVAREVVRSAGVQADAFSLGGAPWISRSAAAMGLRHLVVRRRIDPKLLELNAAGAWNGHVPISACIAFVAELVAYLGGYSAVIVANERTADEGNLAWNGMDINHQWSKSLGFERAFIAWCDRQFAAGPRYFSVLRTLGELRIARAFARHPQYFDAFASCNANFRQAQSDEPARWCGRCPKCVFVQLMLAPYLDDVALKRIFGRDFLDQPENRVLLEELTGLHGVKPFECVGSADESRAALARLGEQGRLDPDLAAFVTTRFGQDQKELSALWDEQQVARGEHCIPAAWEKRLSAYLESDRS